MKPVLIHQKEIALCRKTAVPGQGTAAFLFSTGIDIIQEKSTIYLYKLERFTRRRFTFVSNPITERIIGAFIFFLAGITLTPIVFANTIPGLAIILISFGMINKDGLMVIIGFIVGIFSIFVVWLMISVGLNVVMKVLDKFFTLD